MRPSLLSLIIFAIVLPVFASTENPPALKATQSNETCATNIEDIKSKTSLDSALGSFGGLHALIGRYKMRGLLGAIANTKVEFKVEGNKFWVSINNDKFKQIHLCRDNEKNVTAKVESVLKLRVLTPKTPQNGMILLRPGSDQDQLLVSAHRSNWHFMKFKKIKDTSRAAASISD